MYTEKDHLLGHLLAAALELMVGEKALIAFSGGSPYGFYTDVFPPFPVGVGYLAPLKDHMENFIRKKDLKTYVMEKKNAEAFLAHRNKKRVLKKGVSFRLENLNAGSDAPLWEKSSIAKATEKWFLYMGKS